MTNRRTAQRSVGNGRAQLINVVGDDVRPHSHASFVFNARSRYAVEILATDTDANNEIGEVAAICRDGGLECRELVGENGLAS